MLRFVMLLVLFCVGVARPLNAQGFSWSNEDGQELLTLIESIRSEGLDPADYDPARLRAALASGNPRGLDQVASEIFMHVATDLSEGHVRDRSRIGWHIKAASLAEAGKRNLLQGALARRQVSETLLSLLPRNPEYLRLKEALAATPTRDKAAIHRLRANLERWRWMPRDLGPRYIFVNIPAFELILVENGKILARHKVIVGKPTTPTPRFAALVEAVQLNPWWYVPQSIVAESVGKLVRTNPQAARQRGYVVSGRTIRQRPGPGNALGQMKLVMPNPHTVYIHDTPTKGLFDEEVRAFSHGCIRTQDALGFAATLLATKPGWSRDAIDRVVQSGVTTEIKLDQPIPVYVGYFTAATDAEGHVASFPDIYSRDASVVAGLVDREPEDFQPAP